MKTHLQRIRKERGFKSAKAFADHMGMSPRTYTNYEQGITSLTLDMAWKFADALECTIDELAGRQWPNNAYSDQRQQMLNDDYQHLTESGKDAAAGAVRGIRASESARDESPRLRNSKGVA